MLGMPIRRSLTEIHKKAGGFDSTVFNHSYGIDVFASYIYC